MKELNLTKLSRTELKNVLGGGDEPMYPVCVECSCEFPYPPAYLAYAAAALCDPTPCLISADPNDPNPCQPPIDNG